MTKKPTMPPRVDDPGYWRFRAENARKQANEMTHENERTIILSVAEQYDKLSQLTEERRKQLGAAEKAKP